MARAAKNINGLESLDREIQKLKNHGRMLEKQIDGRLDFLQDNYSSLVMKSVIPSLAGKSGLAGSLLQMFFEQQRLQDTVGKLLSIALDKVSEGLDFVINKIDRHKE